MPSLGTGLHPHLREFEFSAIMLYFIFDPSGHKLIKSAMLTAGSLGGVGIGIIACSAGGSAEGAGRSARPAEAISSASHTGPASIIVVARRTPPTCFVHPMLPRLATCEQPAGLAKQSVYKSWLLTHIYREE